MKFRTGLVVGLAVGYYFGTKAGRERYHQIEEWLDKLRATASYQDARERVAEGLREGTTAARRLIDDAALGSDDDTTAGNLRAIFSDPTLN